MLFYTKQRRYRNIAISNKDGKKICKFKPASNERMEKRGELITKDAKIIKLLKDKTKYPFINWYEEETEKETEKDKIIN